MHLPHQRRERIASAPVAIVHFQPIELYPPVLNDVRYLEAEDGVGRLVVYSTANAKTKFAFSSSTTKTVVRRFGRLPCSTRISRYATYLVFYTRTLLSLLLTRPRVVMYCETLSSFPVLAYKALSRQKVHLLAHYHEITTLDEYANSMWLQKMFHKLERKNYRSYRWISHTNRERLDLFLTQHPEVSADRTHTLPNYPPATWRNQRGPVNAARRVRVVYIGALGMWTMYLREFAEWVVQQKGAVTWDIYSFNVDSDAQSYLDSLKTEFVTFKGDVDYDRIPVVLRGYDVGVILYKGTTINYVLNAPNKLFEYLSGDLDVWVPDNMTGSAPYTTSGTFPRVLSLNFRTLERYAVDDLTSREGLTYQPSTFYSESVLAPLAQNIAAFCPSEPARLTDARTA
jgi:hypothetical protein